MTNRVSLKGPNIPEHGQPFPTATKVGNVVFSSAIGGDDPESHELPDDIEAQVRNAFQTIRNVMEVAGGTPDNIGKVNVFVKSRDDRKFINPEWTKMFPDENSRPVRHTVVHELPPGRLVQIEFIAVI